MKGGGHTCRVTATDISLHLHVQPCGSLHHHRRGLAVTAIVSGKHVRSSRGTRSAHTVLLFLPRSLTLLNELQVPSSPWEDIGLNALQISAVST